MSAGLLLVGCLILPLGAVLGGSDLDEFKVKREMVFEFAQQPVVTRQGDRVTVAFETKGFCDVTVAVEDDKGRIIRHLASGVLGPNAPEPFQKGSKKQVIVWDGKNDQGVYVDDKDALTVRISLGLKPQFERTLFWSPHKRIGTSNSPIIAAAPEGVYVSEGCGVDSLRLYDHEGNYLRTLYPFAADKLQEIQGLTWQEFPQDGQRLPVKAGPKHQSTLFTSGTNLWGGTGPAKYGAAASAIAVHGGRIALVGHKIDRLSTDGTTGSLDLTGPETSLPITRRGMLPTVPHSAAFSPDGKTVYMTGYPYIPPHPEPWDLLHCVMRADFADQGKAEVFLGDPKPYVGTADDAHFNCPASVAVDAQGRIYVADFMNDRIQVFTRDRALVKSIQVTKPIQIGVHPQTGEIYVGSWVVNNRSLWGNPLRIQAVFSRLGPLDDPRVLSSCPLPLRETPGSGRLGGWQYRLAFDFHTTPTTIWLVPGIMYDIGDYGIFHERKDLRGTGLLLLTEKGGTLEIKRDFHEDVAKAVVRLLPPVISRQRLYVNPVDGMLYVGEGDSGVMKSFKQLLRIDPTTGKVRLVELPFTAEDLAIDINGLFYLRDDYHVVRYNPATWEEMPFDYGEERQRVGFDVSARGAPAVAALALPSTGRMGWWHLGGMAVSPSGHLAVTCSNVAKRPDARQTDENPYAKRGFQALASLKKYTPVLYPGRATGWETHIWDDRGRVIHRDVTAGLSVTDGIGLDKDDNVYVLVSANRVLEGKPYLLPWNETLVKVRPQKGFKAVTASDRVQIPLGKDGRPDGPAHLNMWGHGATWLEGAEWAYGGVGFCGGACICWNARPALDLFARSFAPEVDHFSVAVLDTNGNLILRIGKYGNVEDGKPLIPKGGPANPRSIGGDEVALFHAAYLGTHTDHRLFIADAGNSRILSVRLGYHATGRVALKGVADRASR